MKLTRKVAPGYRSAILWVLSIELQSNKFLPNNFQFLNSTIKYLPGEGAKLMS